MIKRYIADLHFQHLNMAIHRGFTNAEEHDEFIIKQWNSVVKSKKDITYILGDLTMEKKVGYQLLSRLNGVKHVILGNHDRRQDIQELLKYVDSVCAVHTDKSNGIIFTHIPIHPRELQFRYKINVHGHLHEHIVETSDWTIEGEMMIPDKRYINVSCEQINYTPKTLEELGIITK